MDEKYRSNSWPWQLSACFDGKHPGPRGSIARRIIAHRSKSRQTPRLIDVSHVKTIRPVFLYPVEIPRRKYQSRIRYNALRYDIASLKKEKKEKVIRKYPRNLAFPRKEALVSSLSLSLSRIFRHANLGKNGHRRKLSWSVSNFSWRRTPPRAFNQCLPSPKPKRIPCNIDRLCRLEISRHRNPPNVRLSLTAIPFRFAILRFKSKAKISTQLSPTSVSLRIPLKIVTTCVNFFFFKSLISNIN